MTHYVIVRKDLPPGFAAAQIVHAAGESVHERVPNGTYAVVLAADDEAHLRRLSAALGVLGVEHALVEEPDAPWCGEATAIGIEPVRCRDYLSPVLGRLRVLK